MSIKTLIVEDDPVWAKRSIDCLVKETGFDVAHVFTLGEAITQVKSTDFDLIVLDLLLPDSDTSENTLNTMTTAAPFVPIVVFTTMDDSKTMEHALLIGVEDFIKKSQFSAQLLIHAGSLAVNRMSARVAMKLGIILNKLSNVDSNMKKLETGLEKDLEKDFAEMTVVH
jgi:DNA-binding NarL/FixJ family response regulator